MGVFDVFSRSWKITKLTFRVIKKDKEMLLFPLISSILSLFFIILMFIPFILSVFFYHRNAGTVEYILLFILYFCLSFIGTFFSVAVVNTARTRFNGEDATFMESIGVAFSKIYYIFLWSVISASVGLIFKIIDKTAEKMGSAGKIILNILNFILGLIWSIATIFVVQGIVYDNLGPFEAIKRSVNVLKKTWGESLIRYYGLGVIQGLLVILGVIIAAPLFIISAGAGLISLTLIVFMVLVIYITLIILVFSVANTVFNTALYVFATTGKIPEGYDREIMKNAFRKKASY